MNGKETVERRLRYGVKLSSLTPEVMENILRIYEETAGVGGLTEDNPATNLISQINDNLNRGVPSEYRFGSMLTGHSKIWIETIDFKEDERVLGFRFSDNLLRSDSKSLRKQGEEIGKGFSQRVTDYLKDKGLAIESSR